MLRKGGNPPARPSEGRAGVLSCQAPGDGEAALRSFLAGFGIGASRECDRLLELLQPGAIEHWHAHPEEDAGSSALLHAEQAFDAWFAAVLSSEMLVGQQALAIGRAAFLACGGPGRWDGLLLREGLLPEEFVAAMRSAASVLAPMPMPAVMDTQSLEAWTVADARRALAAALGVWPIQARPLLTVPIRLDRWTS